LRDSTLALVLLPALTAAGLLLVVSGAIKVARPGPAHAALAAAGLVLPSWCVRALGAAEGALGVFVVLRPGATSALAAALAYGGFALFVARLRRIAGGDAGCGCFGADGGAATTYHALLNALVCGICVAAIVAPPPGPSWLLSRPPLEAAAFGLGTCAIAYACLLAFSAVPRAWRSYTPGDPS
jgi:hypothetical protein